MPTGDARAAARDEGRPRVTRWSGTQPTRLAGTPWHTCAGSGAHGTLGAKCLVIGSRQSLGHLTRDVGAPGSVVTWVGGGPGALCQPGGRVLSPLPNPRPPPAELLDLTGEGVAAAPHKGPTGPSGLRAPALTRFHPTNEWVSCSVRLCVFVFTAFVDCLPLCSELQILHGEQVKPPLVRAQLSSRSHGPSPP